MERVQHIERAEIEKELLLYKTVATQLSKGSDARGIAQTIRKYRDDGPSGVFVVVEAPSGSGKSQLPFVIAAMGIPVVHAIVSLSTQTIYQALEPQSVLIRLALEHDKFKWDTEPGQSDACNLTSLRESNDELALVRVIFHWLGVPDEGLAASTSYTMPTLLSYLRRNPEVSIPVLFLDEVMAIEGGPQALRYARNVFRAAGLVVVLMGTDSTPANLVGATTMVSRRKDTPCEWCHVITRLPHCSKKSLSALGWTKHEQLASSRRFLVSLGGCHQQLSTYIESVLLTCYDRNDDDVRCRSSFERQFFPVEFRGHRRSNLDVCREAYSTRKAHFGDHARTPRAAVSVPEHVPLRGRPHFATGKEFPGDGFESVCQSSLRRPSNVQLFAVSRLVE